MEHCIQRSVGTDICADAIFLEVKLFINQSALTMPVMPWILLR